MTNSTINFLFYVCLVILICVGATCLVFWSKKIYPGLLLRIERDAERSGRLNTGTVGIRVLISMLPLLIIVLLFCVPVFYLYHLSNQEDYCLEIIRVNHLKAGDAFLKERCGRLDENELIEKSKL